jgi:hypothetical protein
MNLYGFGDKFLEVTSLLGEKNKKHPGQPPNTDKTFKL